jgi:hypothetical protein
VVFPQTKLLYILKVFFQNNPPAIENALFRIILVVKIVADPKPYPMIA